MSPRERAAELLRKSVWLQGHGPPLIKALLTHGRIVHLAAGAWAQGCLSDKGWLKIFSPRGANGA